MHVSFFPFDCHCLHWGKQTKISLGNISRLSQYIRVYSVKLKYTKDGLFCVVINIICYIHKPHNMFKTHWEWKSLHY